MFGATNASFVWATGVLMDRLDPEGGVPALKIGARATKEPDPATLQGRGRLLLRSWDNNVRQTLDPWLPQAGRKPDWRQILGGLLFLPCLVSIRSGTGYLSSYCMGWVGERVVNDLRMDLLRKLSTLSLDFFNRSRSGDLITRLTHDTATIQRTLRIGFADLVKESVTVLGLLVALLIIDPWLTLFSMTVLPLCLVPILVLGRKARRASKASIRASVFQSNQLVELLSSIRVVKAFGLESAQLERFRGLSREMVRQGMKGVKAKEMVNPVIEVVSTFAIGVLIVYLVASNRSIGDLVQFLTGLIIFYTPVKKLAAIHIMLEQTSVGVARLMEVFREQPSVREPEQPRAVREFTEAIRFDAVSFAYGEQPVVKDLTLDVPRGHRLGVAGPSGSGKSTLVNLLFRFYDPTHGRITLDGVDLREMHSGALRSLMALVSQDVVIFDKSIAENIACGREGATRPEVEVAARSAFAHDFIAQLPEGYETVVGERGVTLSGGQRQRIAIARAFVRNAPILVLDEATAALDAEAEGVVQAAIERLAENRTVICIAHRLATLAAMDEIIFLADGRLVEQGSFEALLEANGSFAEMARRQGIQSGAARRMEASR
jgi:subfamily B ATP-binding cassette protein MsbA